MGSGLLLLYATSFAAAFLICIGLTAMARRLGRAAGLMDLPDGHRRIHDQPIPRTGGVAIFVAVGCVFMAALVLDANVVLNSETLRPVIAIMSAGTAIFLLGLWDDAKGLSARFKFGFESVVAFLLFNAGIGIDGITLPGGTFVDFPYIVSAAITVLWVVGVTNAFNLIDGADGVAAGAGFFASFAMAVVFLLGGYHVGAMAALALAGALLGFLHFNFPPASIFLGDSGSLFVGFILASLGLVTTQTAPTLLAVLIPVVTFGLPILDTMLAIMRRLLRGDAMFTPDRGHIHHRLSDLGATPRQVALLMCAVSLVFAVLSVTMLSPATRLTTALLIVTCVVLAVGVRRLDIPELLEFSRLVRRGVGLRHAVAVNLRVRTAIARVRAAGSTREALEGFAEAIAAAEYSSAELWLDNHSGHMLLADQVGFYSDGGIVWRWERETADDEIIKWECRVPFSTHDGRQVGWLALWQSGRERSYLTDALIASELQPALLDALNRAGTSVQLRTQKGGGPRVAWARALP